ncbi:hypothetical protein [Paenibacillus piri]|uniref:ParA family protein n=1 Tax=Paenibacillus piri TaxID=2547395 RepID=A0A4R5KFC0_9BACL|nr:hypothetical protein [Paenibacillus piri]TDF94119.1 hypothetical protein E1757_24840 [Paenibacillus piri]
MNIYVVSSDRRLLDSLRMSGSYGSVVSVSKDMVIVMEQAAPLRAEPAGKPFEAPVAPGDAWLVSDALLDIHEAIALRGIYPDNKFIYMLSNSSEPLALKAAQTLCAAHAMQYILPYRTPKQVAEAAANICLSRERSASKVITAVGALPQTGLTTSLVGLGVTLSRLSGARIGILGMNGWNPGDSGFRYSAKYLDELWGSLQGKQLQAAELPGKMQRLSQDVHYLAGNRDLKKLYYYQTDGVSWLIEKARECYDIVLIDAGSYPDHALAAQSIHAADLLLVQTDQSQQAKAQWRRLYEHILQPVFQWEERQTMLLFNKMHRSPDVENEKQLSRQLEMPYIGSLPYVPSFYRSETEGSLLAFPWPDYEKELQKVSRAIMHYYGLPSVDENESDRTRPRALPNGSGKPSWLSWMRPAKEA